MCAAHPLGRKSLDRLGVTMDEKAGTARFVDPYTIEAQGGLRLKADKIILCAGGTSRRLPIPGFELTSTHSDAWGLTAIPPSMLVVGGGATVNQLASIFNALPAVSILPGWPAHFADRRRGHICRHRKRIPRIRHNSAGEFESSRCLRKLRAACRWCSLKMARRER